jgi:hypothetical protein
MSEMSGFQVYSKLRKIDSDVKSLFVIAAEITHEEFSGKTKWTRKR